MDNKVSDNDKLFKVPDVNTTIVKKSSNIHIQTIEKRKAEKHVLDEKTYITGLERIIERDYYPELKKLRVQKEYLDAVKDGDVEKVEELKKCYGSKRVNYSEATSIETPSIHTNESEYETTDREPRNLLDNYCVDSYLDRYTSEDNRDFDIILDRQNEELKKTHKWIHKAIEDHNIKHNSLVQSLPAADEQALEIANNESSKFKEPLGWKATLKNGIFCPLEEVPLTIAESIEREAKNQLIINKKGTRLSTDVFSKQQLEKNKSKFDIFGKKAEVDITGKKIEENKAIEEILDKITSNDGSESPNMTWGYIDGTPFRLDGNDSSNIGNNTPAFRMSDISEKEQIARNLIDNIIASKEAKKRENISVNTSSVRSNTISGRIMNMTPASQNLLKSKLGFSSISTPHGSSWQSSSHTWDTPSTSRGFQIDTIKKLIKKKQK
uniref:LsmAD domain-containing protein n=1 Tax=Parastrongyloides trichosuri TaxID=131310 RepID=A0A0N4ZEX1_PARTI